MKIKKYSKKKYLGSEHDEKLSEKAMTFGD